MMTIQYAHGWNGTPHRANAAHPGNVKTDTNPNGGISVQDGTKTGVLLATLCKDGPNGGFFSHGQKRTLVKAIASMQFAKRLGSRCVCGATKTAAQKYRHQVSASCQK